MKCLIVDDEPLALDLLESYVVKTPFLELAGKCDNALSALQTLANAEVDLIFLDIQMPEMNGMELAKVLQGRQKIIFTTAFENYAIEGYKVNAIGYLLKPISYTEFLQAATKAQKAIETETFAEKPIQNQSFFVKSDYKIVQVEYDKILYIESVKDYIHIHIEGSNEPIISLMSIKNLEDNLPPEIFMRVHRSFIVNLNKIKTIERNRIVFGKIYIPISDSYKDKFAEFLKTRFL